MPSNIIKNVNLNLEQAIAELMGIDLASFHTTHAPLDLYDGLEQSFAIESYDFEDLISEGLDEETATKIASRTPKSFYRLEVAEYLYARLAGEIAKHREKRATPIVLVDDPGPVGDYDNVTLTKQSIVEWAVGAGVTVPLEKLESLSESSSRTLKVGDGKLEISSIDDTIENSEGHALSLCLAWFIDAFLEMQVPNWRAARFDMTRLDRAHWFIKKRPNVISLVSAIKSSLPKRVPVSDSTIYKRVGCAIEAIESEYKVIDPFSSRKSAKTYPCLFALAQQVAGHKIPARQNQDRVYSPKEALNAAQDLPISRPSSLDEHSALLQLDEAWGTCI